MNINLEKITSSELPLTLALQAVILAQIHCTHRNNVGVCLFSLGLC